MKTGTCPKCGSTDVRVSTAEGHRSIILGGFLGMSGFRVMDYICPDCGYVENSIYDLAGSRDRIREKLPRVKH